MPTNTYQRFTTEEWWDILDAYEELGRVCSRSHQASLATVLYENHRRGMFLLGRAGVYPYTTVKTALEILSASTHPDIVAILEYAALEAAE